MGQGCKSRSGAKALRTWSVRNSGSFPFLWKEKWHFLRVTFTVGERRWQQPKQIQRLSFLIGKIINYISQGCFEDLIICIKILAFLNMMPNVLQILEPDEAEHVFLCNSSLSVQFSHSVVSNSLWPHELQHARPPCPSPTPGVHPNSRPSSRWCHPAISSSVIPFSSCPKSLPASESFPMSQLFAWGGQSTGV